MNKYNVILNFAEGTCTLAGQKIDLTRQSEVRSMIRTVNRITVPPRTLVIAYGKYYSAAQVGAVGDSLQWEQHPTCFLQHEPGLMVMNGLGKVSNRRAL